MRTKLIQLVVALVLVGTALVRLIPPKFTHYTLDVGYVSGQAGAVQPAAAASAKQAQAQQPSPTVVLVAPVITSTSNPDGSILHPVQFGQALITIAKAYGLSLEDLKKRNNLTSDTIFQGQKLIIQGSSTPTLKPTITLTPIPPTRTATFTRTPTLPPTPAPTLTATPTATPPPLIPSLDSIDQKTLGEVILGISAIGLVVVLISLFIKKKS
jgi:LysM repeat protein